MMLPPVTDVITKKCHPDPNNRRTVYERETLKTSIAREGILQPLGLRLDAARDCYFALWGNSRLLCALDLGLETVPARVWERVLSRLEVAKYQAAENLARSELRPSERAATYRELMDLEGLTAGEFASQWGVSAATVSRCLSLLDQPADIIALVDEGTLPLSTAAILARLPEEDTRREMIRRIREGHLSRDRVEEAVQARTGKRDIKARENRISCKLGEVNVSVAGGSLEEIAGALQKVLRRVKAAAEQGLDPTEFARALRQGCT